MTITPAATSTVPLTGNRARIAGAPISWGVCEVPNWGHQLAPKHVLTEKSAPVASRRLSYTEGVVQGMYRPLARPPRATHDGHSPWPADP